MPRNSKQLFKARLIRRSSKTGEVVSKREEHTQAVSKAQAERFIQRRFPGYRITSIVEV